MSELANNITEMNHAIIEYAGEAITYKIEGNPDIAMTASVTIHEQALERQEEGRNYQTMATVLITVSSDGSDGPTLAQLQDFQTHSLSLRGQDYQVISAQVPEIAGELATLECVWLKDLTRQKQSGVRTMRRGGKT